ncbi:YjjG family noncanonical pyrimidine nucleotidase [Parabacteroides sp. FAFU027]|uniref:YjjG family noncanonical pyrimidine nucleotidase n=1 Tax=Parabacteroides sp. FAFU027 TaxID=2922715 RepID=UPI001FAEEF78|nr:YjjG family noncanonical pyrimidine nucleotidase [Parabacteroides sp. FAFU027]
MRKYKSVFVDLDDTLWDTKSNSREGMTEIFFQYKLEEYFESFEHYYGIYTERNQELWHQYHHGQIGKQFLISERFLHPLRFAGLADENLAIQMNSDYLDAVSSKTQLIPNAKDLLEYLYPKYRLFVLSNGFRDVQQKKLANSGLLGYFEKIITSEDVGVNKPYPGIFEYALKSTNSRKKESIMIGDNPEADIAGAYNYKLDQIYFMNFQCHSLPFTPTYSVDTLDEVKSIL